MADIAIGIGLGTVADELPPPATVIEWVERADELGIDSIWVPDHPISDSPALDTTAFMAVIAARTDDIKMGPSVLTLPARNPVAVASAYATLAYLTGGRGRVIMGLGLGADPQLCELLGIPPDERAPRLREAVTILRRCWSEPSVDFDGTYYQLEDVTVTPRPADGPLDIWIGGNSEAALKRVAAYGDGWFPALLPPAVFAAKLDRLMDYCDAEGRQIDRDEAGVIIPTFVTDDPDRADHVRERFVAGREGETEPATVDTCTAFGTPADCVETVQRYVDAGCTKFVLSPVGPAADTREQIERYGTEVIPGVESAGSMVR